MWLRNAVSDQLGHLKLVSVGEQRLQRESRGIPNVTTHVASFVPIRRVCPHHWLEIGGMLNVRWPGLLLRSVWQKQFRTHWQQWQEFADCWGSSSSHHDTGTLDSSGRPYFKVSLNHFSAACQLDSYIPWWIIFFSLTIHWVVTVVCNQESQTVQNSERTEKGFYSDKADRSFPSRYPLCIALILTLAFSASRKWRLYLYMWRENCEWLISPFFSIQIHTLLSEKDLQVNVIHVYIILLSV